MRSQAISPVRARAVLRSVATVLYGRDAERSLIERLVHQLQQVAFAGTIKRGSQ